MSHGDLFFAEKDMSHRVRENLGGVEARRMRRLASQTGDQASADQIGWLGRQTSWLTSKVGHAFVVVGQWLEELSPRESIPLEG
jgi:hypothetical protein